MLRRLAVLLLLVLSLLGLSACGDDDAPGASSSADDSAADDDSATDDPAADDAADDTADDAAEGDGTLIAQDDLDGDGIVVTVNGSPITEDELAAELAVVRDDFRWQVEEDSQSLERNAVKLHFGTVASVDELMEAPFRAEAVAGILDRMIDDRMVTLELERLGGEVTPDDRLGAAEQSLRDAESPYFDHEVQRFARQLALGRMLAESPDDVDEAVVEAAYRLVLPREGRVCTRHILLATLEDAQFVKDQLDAGTDFASTAAAVSLDPSTAADGGDLGCIARGEAPDDMVSLEDAAWSAEPGEVVGPIETGRGFHLLEVTGYDPSLDDARATILDTADLLAVAWVQVAREGADVDLDEQRGTWDPVEIGPPAGG
ncbi:MAG: peptidylprolyl isomerase [Acidimicrobiales bacterium]|nr:peptidylprolyl isomerase [Acidimicrobiales bacterium]